MTSTVVDRDAGERFEEALAARLYRDSTVDDARLARLAVEDLAAAAQAVRRLVLERTHRGTGGVRDWFPRTVAAWRARHPDDAALDDLARAFAASTHAAAWRESDAGRVGISLEEAFARFFGDAGVGDEATREEELASAIVRALAVAPASRFRWPPPLRPAPGGCFTVTRALVLHAAIDGRYLRGEVTPLVAAVLRGECDDERVAAELRRMRLLA